MFVVLREKKEKVGVKNIYGESLEPLNGGLENHCTQSCI
jgi:hypothetical protein